MLDTIMAYAEAAPAWITALLAVFAALKGITALTPTQLDDDALGIATTAANVLLRIVNTLALNVGKDRNADDPGAKA